MILMLMMSLWWMYVVNVHGECRDHVGYPWKGKGIGLRILSILGEGRGLLRIFNYPRPLHWWCPCFILHNCMEVVQTLSVSTYGFSWGKMLVLGDISLGLEHRGGGGSFLCTIGWPWQLLPSFHKRECHVNTLWLFLNEWYHVAF